MGNIIVNPQRDNYIDLVDSGTNNGTSNRIRLSLTATTEFTILVTFDLTAFKDSSLILSATLELNLVTTVSNSLDWFIHRLRRTIWAETTSTWLQHGAAGNWETAGAKGVALDIDSIVPPVLTDTMPGNTPTGWYSFGNVLPFVQDAIDNRSGLCHMRIAQRNVRSATIFVFRSREDITAGPEVLQPKLTIQTSDSGGYPAMSHFNLVTPKII